MLKQWRDRRLAERRAAKIYPAVSEAARDQRLYVDMRVADSVDGRLEMLALHLVLVMDRLRRVDPDGDVLAQALGEAFVAHMDDTMRAIGVGDLAVPRKVKKAAAALYDAHREYGPALIAAGDARPAWLHALQLRLVSRAMAPAADIEALATHALAWHAQLKALPDASVVDGRLSQTIS